MRYLLIIWFCCCFAPIKADPVQLDRETWSEIKEGLNYEEKSEKKTPVKEKENKEEKNYEPITRKKNLLPSFDFGAIRALSLVIVLVLLVVLIVYFVDKDLFRKKSRASRLLVSIDNPDYLDRSDLEKALEMALDQQNYRAGIRIYYLMLLERLDTLRLIHWKKAKTNRQYILEIKKPGIQKDLRRLTRFYEDIWFGQKAIDNPLYTQWANEFQQKIKEAADE